MDPPKAMEAITQPSPVDRGKQQSRRRVARVCATLDSRSTAGEEALLVPAPAGRSSLGIRGLRTAWPTWGQCCAV